NVHLAAREGARSGPQTDEDTFVALREKRDSQLAAPRLLLPSVQFNMRGARLPPPEDNGVCYLKIPVRAA
ncbi:MAG: hypothetical protein OES38_03100, partial [Gammaproteobacteria bacterium]|nr:hypothetical protein [Gammaproteobacteria bacterium]